MTTRQAAAASRAPRAVISRPPAGHVPLVVAAARVIFRIALQCRNRCGSKHVLCCFMQDIRHDGRRVCPHYYLERWLS